MESGQTMEVSPIYMSSKYRERIDAHVDALHKSAMRAGADHRLVNITEPLTASFVLTFCFAKGVAKRMQALSVAAMHREPLARHAGSASLRLVCAHPCAHTVSRGALCTLLLAGRRGASA
jgi:hypothetical protein